MRALDLGPGPLRPAPPRDAAPPPPLSIKWIPRRCGNCLVAVEIAAEPAVEAAVGIALKNRCRNRRAIPGDFGDAGAAALAHPASEAIDNRPPHARIMSRQQGPQSESGHGHRRLSTTPHRPALTMFRSLRQLRRRRRRAAAATAGWLPSPPFRVGRRAGPLQPSADTGVFLQRNIKSIHFS